MTQRIAKADFEWYGVEIPAEVTERMQQRVERWSKLCAKYRAMAPAEAGA